ncbi:hypothetical protein DFH08DRAFT_824718 [Mycena albidolilacea]|uniref:Uncharacterized protein n=1 Tax=Mycena albidolilacea TaxID=1033008 RepID=A0AAD6Z3G6_9AGAR|nr:hypothetical protein DFH08DRAFT_824718 [Mycena albidolilacea]
MTTHLLWFLLSESLRRGAHSQILSQIQLFLVNEVHILNEIRGSTLEVVISHMKMRGLAVRSDIAFRIGNERRDGAATIFELGEDFRPCKLTWHVIGVPRLRGDNDFSFARLTLQAHSVGKPISVFLSTRKGAVQTAKQLKNDYAEAEKMRRHLPWSHPRRICAAPYI